MRKTLLALALILGWAALARAQQYQTQTAPLFGANAKYLNGTSAGYAPTKGTGLTLNISAGRVRCANTMTNYAGGTLTMTNGTTNYVYLDTASSCAPASNTSGYTATGIAVATVVTSGGAITAITDDRTLGLQTGISATVTGGTCTNQVVTAISTAGAPTCTTVTSAYVNNSIALTGADINTSNQVVATHLSSALPVNQGGTGTASTLTGIVRGGSPLTASELSGDATTSGSNAVTLASKFKQRVIGFSYGDPAAASTLTSGSTTTAYNSDIPFACTISRYSVAVDAGTITVKFWKVASGTALPTSSNSINTSGVGVSSGTVNQSTTLSDFTSTSVTAHDIMAMNVVTVSGAHYVTANLECDQ